jgi:hypothetical protein
MLHTVSAEGLAQVEADASTELSDALERGSVVFFPRTPVALPSTEDLAFLRGLGAQLARKNVSFYPDGNRLVGLADVEVRERARAILHEHGRRVRELLTRAIPRFFRGARTGTTSFRPLQERGRQLSAHASNELIHVDAGAYGATHGDRILRFFVNANEREDRVWASKGSFRELFGKYGSQAGVRRGSLQPSLWGRAFSGAVGVAGSAIPALNLIDTSDYDRRMRRFHNFMKDEASFRDSSEGQVELRFPAGSAWMVLTDAVSHACLEGQHAFVDTFIVPLANCRLREHAPWDVLAAG